MLLWENKGTKVHFSFQRQKWWIVWWLSKQELRSQNLGHTWQAWRRSWLQEYIKDKIGAKTWMSFMSWDWDLSSNRTLTSSLLVLLASLGTISFCQLRPRQRNFNWVWLSQLRPFILWRVGDRRQAHRRSPKFWVRLYKKTMHPSQLKAHAGWNRKKLIKLSFIIFITHTLTWKRRNGQKGYLKISHIIGTFFRGYW